MAELNKQVSTLQTVDCWAEEATTLRKMNHQVMRDVEDLKNKTVSHLVEFYHKFATTGGVTPLEIFSQRMFLSFRPQSRLWNLVGRVVPTRRSDLTFMATNKIQPLSWIA